MDRLNRRYRLTYFTQTIKKFCQTAAFARFDVSDLDTRIYTEQIKVYRGISSHDDTEVRTECENR